MRDRIHGTLVSRSLHSSQACLCPPHFVNLTDHFGDTPLHLALKSNHLDCVEYLLCHGADASSSPQDVFMILDGWDIQSTSDGSCQADVLRVLCLWCVSLREKGAFEVWKWDFWET